MRTLSLLGLSLVLVLSAMSCSGGGGDDDDGGGCPDMPATGSLSSGTYEISCWDQIVDECRALENENGNSGTITVSGTSLTLGGYTGTIIGTDIATSQNGEIDFNDDPYGFGAVDCVVDLAAAITGITIGVDVADLSESYDVTVVSGAECADAEEGVSQLAGGTINFPCHSESEYRATKLP